MKHIKLFEQFEDEDAWWDSDVAYNNNKIKMKIAEYSNGKFFIVQEANDKILLYKNCNINHFVNMNVFRFNPILDDDSKIYIYDRDGIYPREGTIYDPKADHKWKCYPYKNLPQEIKDQIII